MGKCETIGPFVRWAGGKTWFCNRIERYLPSAFSDYYEPFLGGGSVFYHLYHLGLFSNNIYLSDLNAELVQAYIDVRDNCDLIISFLDQVPYDADEYYRIRAMYNSNINLHLRGAYFIYLNRVGFNGVYRISRTGNYNVPYGCGRGKITKEYKDLLKADSKALKGVSITQGSFDYLLDSEFHFKPQSLIFLDPPYTVSHNNNGFIAYNRNLFDIESQRRLRRLLDKIDSEGAYFIMTNAKHSIIREIFDGYFFHEEFRSSVIGGKGARRGLISEYIVTNFEKE